MNIIVAVVEVTPSKALSKYLLEERLGPGSRDFFVSVPHLVRHSPSPFTSRLAQKIT